MVDVPEESTRVAARKAGLLRSSLTLLAGAVALTLLVMLMRDYHRRIQLLDGAREYAEMLARVRVGDSGALPLNLEATDELKEVAGKLRLEWLSHAEALQLRDSSRPVIVVWSAVLPMWLGRDGRGVIVFHEGRLTAAWLSNQVFEQRQAAQQEELRRLGSGRPELP